MMRGLRLLLPVWVAAACAAATPGTGATPDPIASAGPFLYICNQGIATVSVLDIGTQEIVHTVDLQELGFTANAKPHHVAVEPDGSFWYVSLIGESKVLKFDASNTLVGQADFEVPGMLAIHPTEDLLVVGRSMSAVNPPQRIGLIRRSDLEVEELDVFFPRPHAIAISPDGSFVYTASLAANLLASVEIQTNPVMSTPAPNRPPEIAQVGRIELVQLEGPTHTLVQFAISPDGSTMVGTAQLTGRLFVFDLADPANPRVVAEIDVDDQPWHPVFTLDGRWVYFGNKTANSITVVDMQRREVAGVLRGEGIGTTHGSAVSPDGRWIYISSNAAEAGTDPAAAGSVVVIDATTREVTRVIATGPNTTGLGAWPGGGE